MSARDSDRPGLRYVHDGEPGLTRKRRGKGFAYYLPDGELLRDRAQRKRIEALAIPPAYDHVWICPDENGHLQATGVDSLGRKQYRYHPEWEAWRARRKFDRLVEFGAVLPRIRRRIRRDMAKGLPNEDAILGAMAALLDKVHMRVGNRSYAKTNRTFGLTSLMKRHVDVDDGRIRLDFTAKGGSVEHYELAHPALHDLLEEIADLPGRDLFSWRTEDGDRRVIDSGRLNAYLSAIGGPGVTAKTFRTWAGSVAAFEAAEQAIREGRSPKVKDLCQAAADRLHNTPAVCRSSYVHPAVLDLAETVDGRTLAAEDKGALSGGGQINGATKQPAELSAVEARFLAFIANQPDRD